MGSGSGLGSGSGSGPGPGSGSLGLGLGEWEGLVAHDGVGEPVFPAHPTFTTSYIPRGVGRHRDTPVVPGGSPAGFFGVHV